MQSQCQIILLKSDITQET